MTGARFAADLRVGDSVGDREVREVRVGIGGDSRVVYTDGSWCWYAWNEVVR